VERGQQALYDPHGWRHIIIVTSATAGWVGQAGGPSILSVGLSHGNSRLSHLRNCT